MVDYGKQLLSKIEDRSAVVGIIGLGYVGLPLALAFTEKGFRVIGFDTDPVKIDKITSGDCYIKHLDPTRLTRAIGGCDENSKFKIQNSKLLQATCDFSRLAEADAVLICVPTPLGPHKEPDLQYVEASAKAIRETLRPGQLIVLESTTYPGTTEDLLLPILEDGGEPRMAAGTAAPQTAPAPLVGQASRLPNEKSEINDRNSNRGNNQTSDENAGRAGQFKIQNSKFKIPQLCCGTHFFLAFSPEREDPGNPTYGTTNVPKIVGGVDPLSGDLAQALYDQVVDATVRTSSASIAEAAKITENVFRSVNIALVNELKVIYDRLGIDIWEVLDAAETKPFGFMRFNPGPGLGGHCIIGTEWLRVRGCGISGVYRAADLFKLMSRQHPAVATRNGIFVEPAGLEALALDSKSGEVDWFPVSTLYRGRFEGSGRQFTTCDNRRLVVTSEHPMLVVGEDTVETVSARDVQPGDILPLVSDLGDSGDNPRIDLLDIVPAEERERVWVRINDREWCDFESELKSHFGWTIRDSIRKNSLRLDRFLEIEDELALPRNQLVLMTGRGRARREWPVTLEFTPDFARFLGYYLAEGCITVERNASRVRLTFNRDEMEYIEDARSILDNHGFPTSVYNDATWHSTTIKASTLILVWLLDGLWGCGRRSEDMRVPDVVFRLSPEHKVQILSGLLRGDGDVWTRHGKSTYTKNGKQYSHNNATAVVGFFSSSQILLEQVIHLLQDVGFQPSYKKWKHHLRLSGHRTIGGLIPFFDGAKRDRLEHLQKRRRRRVKSRSDKAPLAPGLRSTEVKATDRAFIDGWVYSMEVEGSGAFTTSSGICVHNCIPLDPFYLAWRAREAGVPTRFIELAGEINTSMPGFVIEKLQAALNENGKAVKGANILVLGLAYKPNIDDPRESPAFEIIERLLHLGAEVGYHDPHVPVSPKMRSWPDLPQMESMALSQENLAGVDAAILITDHAAVDYALVLEHTPLIIDTRGVFRDHDDKVHPA